MVEEGGILWLAKDRQFLWFTDVAPILDRGIAETSYQVHPPTRATRPLVEAQASLFFRYTLSTISTSVFSADADITLSCLGRSICQ
jgi:hypothetical protein